MEDYPLVLIVEDNSTQQQLFRLIADRCRISPHIVETCQEVQEALRTTSSYALILMDWSLGRNSDNTGLECTRVIRKHEQENGGHIPIIGVTGRAMKGDREQCLDAGMDDYLSKPFSLEDLETIINK